MKARLRQFGSIAAALSTLVAGALWTTPAAAQSKLSLDLGAAFPEGSGNGDGWGGGVRFGHEWDLAILSLTPEVAFQYHDFSGANDPTTIAFLGGGRLAIGFALEPSVFAHAGVGHVDGNAMSHTSLAYDVGAALDLTILPVIDFGPHVMFSGIAGENDRDAFSWVEVGGHVTFNFGGGDDD